MGWPRYSPSSPHRRTSCFSMWICPRLRGVETLAAIQGLAPDTKVIMISGKAEEREARQALAAGAFDYIGKPFDLAYLDQAVRIAILS